MKHPSLVLASTLLVLSACGGLTSKLCGGLDQPCCEALACSEGGRCSAAGICQACGGVGQACCQLGSACGQGAACEADVCLPCGARGQSCCGTTCAGALACTEGTCVDASCANPCNVGASKCMGGGIETCSAVGVCPNWRSTVAVCPSGTSCVATGDSAQCVEPCPGACVPNTVVCTVEGLKRCMAAGGACPTLVAETDSEERPKCVTGGVVGTEVVWESPTPLSTHLLAVAGDMLSSYWVLDELGNIVHNSFGTWEYEVRAIGGKRAVSLASCKLGSRLVAGGQGGTLYRRGFGTWTEENVGNSAVTLVAVACDFNNTFALGSDGRLYHKVLGGSWDSTATGSTGGLNGLASLAYLDQVYLVGDGGKIIRCQMAPAPVTCVSEASGTTQRLNAAWAHSSGRVFAVGAGGTILELSGTTWGPAPIARGTVTEDLYAVHGVSDAADNIDALVAGGEGAAWVGAAGNGPWYKSQVGQGRITGVMAISETDIVVSTTLGQLWSATVPGDPPLVTRGGFAPTTELLRGITSLADGRLLAVGVNGTVLKRENGTWLSDAVGVPSTMSLFGVAGRDNSEAYAVGRDASLAGKILVRRYGTWSDDAPGQVYPELYAVAIDRDKAWAVGAAGTWLEKAPGGAWTPVGQTVTGDNLSALAVRTDSQGRAVEVIAVGGHCTVLSLMGGTVAPLSVPACPVGTDLLSATFSSSGELYVGGTDGLVLHRTSNGFQAEYLGFGTLEPVNGLAGQGASMWALCTAGEIYRRSGSAWVRFAQDVTEQTFFSAVSTPVEGMFFVGSYGTIWRKP